MLEILYAVLSSFVLVTFVVLIEAEPSQSRVVELQEEK